MNIKIGTLNCQNSKENRTNRNDRARLLAWHILEKRYDILGMQELTMGFSKKVDAYLKNYNFYGDYQYGKGLFGTKFPGVKTYNQGNHVVTKLPAQTVVTKSLPWLRYSLKEFIRALKKGSIARRIITRVEIEIDGERVYIFNTHLDYYTPSLQQKQLAYILKQVKKYRQYGQVILMGDFNLETYNPMFVSFTQELEKLDIVKVPVNEKTNAKKYKKKTAIDHIFIPKHYRILECGTMDMESLQYLTDHKAVYVIVSTN